MQFTMKPSAKKRVPDAETKMILKRLKNEHEHTKV